MINTMPTAKNRESISPLKYRSKKSMRATATPPQTSHEKNLARFHTWCERNVVPYPQRSIGNEEKVRMMRILRRGIIDLRLSIKSKLGIKYSIRSCS